MQFPVLHRCFGNTAGSKQLLYLVHGIALPARAVHTWAQKSHTPQQATCFNVQRSVAFYDSVHTGMNFLLVLYSNVLHGSKKACQCEEDLCLVRCDTQVKNAAKSLRRWGGRARSKVRYPHSWRNQSPCLLLSVSRSSNYSACTTLPVCSTRFQIIRLMQIVY